MNIRYSLLFLLVLFTSGSIAIAQTSINGKVFAFFGMEIELLLKEKSFTLR